MIQIDKELEWKLNYVQKDLKVIIFKIKIKKIIIYTLFILAIIYVVLLGTGLSHYTTNTTILCILTLILFIITVILISSYEKCLSNDILELQKKRASLEKTIEDIKDFSVYLLACRKIEAVNNKNDIYPELRYNDAKHVIEQFKELYEEKRLKYEEKHKNDNNINTN